MEPLCLFIDLQEEMWDGRFYLEHIPKYNVFSDKYSQSNSISEDSKHTTQFKKINREELISHCEHI